MSRVVYCVIATLPDAPTAARFIAWLNGGHIRQVIDGGAESGIAVRLDSDGPPRAMAQYTFTNRAAFDHYVRDAAPALRAAGLKEFPGVRFERMVGEVV